MDIEKKKYEQAKSEFRNLLQEVKDFLDEDSSGVKTQGQVPAAETSTEGETPAKVEEAKQKEYFDSLKEERSRVLIKHLMEVQQQKPQ